MTLPIVYFTYDKDEELLLLSLKAVDRLREKYAEAGISFPVYVLDDAKHPLSTVPPEVVYWQTEFDRGGNLMGMECVEGMLDSYKTVMELEKDAKCLIKCDCDTYINDIRHLLSINMDVLSMAGYKNNNQFIAGPTYALSREAVLLAKDMIARPDVRIRLVKYSKGLPEDHVIYRLCNSMPRLLTMPVNGIALAHHYAFNNTYEGNDALSRLDSVTFKRYTQIVEDGALEDERKLAVKRMSEYVAGKEENNNTTITDSNEQ